MVDYYYLVGFDSDYDKAMIRLLIPVRELTDNRKSIYFPYSGKSKWKRCVVTESELYQLELYQELLETYKDWYDEYPSAIKYS